MKRFQFRLDSVLKLRRAALDAARRDLARVSAEMEIARAEAEAARAIAERAASELESRTRCGVRAGEFSARSHALTRQLELRHAAAQRLRDALGRVAGAREEVTRAHIEVRSLEILRDRALEAHRAEERRLEQNDLDERAGQRRARVSRAPHLSGASR